MKLLLLLWASGALGGPCKPSAPSTTSYSLPSTESASSGSDSHSLSETISIPEGTRSIVTTDEHGNTVTIPEATGGVITTDENGNTITGPLPEKTSSIITTDENGNTATVPVPGETGGLSTDKNDNTLPGAGETGGTVTTDENENTVTVPGSETSGVVTTDEDGNTVTVPGPDETSSAATTDENGSTVTLPEQTSGPGETTAVVTTDENGNTVTIPGGPTDAASTDATGSVATTDDKGNTITLPEGTSGVVTTDENGNTVTVPNGTATGPSTEETGDAVTTDENGNTVTIPQGPSGTQTSPFTDGTGATVITDDDGNTTTVPGMPSGTATGPSTEETGDIVTTDENGNTVTVPEGPSGTATAPSTEETGSVVTTDESGNTVTVPEGTATGGSTEETGGIVTTDDSGSTVTMPNETSGTTTGLATDETGVVTTDENGNTVTVPEGSSGTQTGSFTQSEGTETGSQTHPTNTETGTETGTATQPGNTEIGSTSSGDETTTTQLGNSDESTDITTSTDASGAGSTATSGATSTGSVPPQTTTDGPVSTSPPEATTKADETGSYTSTMTAPPEEWDPTCVSGHPEWTSNTWITTTSEGSAQQTVVPVLVGTKDCDDDGSGIILFGFPPITGTLFKFPGFPSFSFPCIPILNPGCTTPPKTESGGGEDGDGEDDNKSTKSDDEASSTCTEEMTASDCFVACTTYTGPVDATIAPECTTTCTKTHTGCSVTGVTTTSGAEACSATGDEACNGECSEDISWEPVDLDDSSEDDGTVDNEPLRKRWSKDNTDPDVGWCKGIPINFPIYPEGGDLWNNEADIRNPDKNSPLRDIHFWYYSTRVNCVLRLSPEVNHAGYWAGNYPSTNAALNEARKPTVDHAFEKSFLRDYFRFITPRNNPNFPSIRGTTPRQDRERISCSDLKWFGSSGETDMNFIKDIYRQYPGAQGDVANPIHPLNAHWMEDFIGMDYTTNAEAKGFATTVSLVKKNMNTVLAKKIDPVNSNWAFMYNTIKPQIDLLERIALGAEVLNMQVTKDAMARQNLRIYKALQDTDRNLRDCKREPAAQKFSFAARYKVFMDARFDGTMDHSLNPVWADVFRQVATKTTADFQIADAKQWPPNIQAKAKRELAELHRMYDGLRAKLQGQFPKVTIDWGWPAANAKRDDEDDLDGGSCAISTTSSETATTLSTMTRSQPGSESGSTTDGSSETSDANLSTSDASTQGPGSTTAEESTTTEEATSTSEAPKPTSTTVLCASVDDCKDVKCDEGLEPICGLLIPLPGIPQVCRCVKPPEEEPTTTKEETPEPTESEGNNPNADVPEVECSTPDDCGDWEGSCHFASDNNRVVCLATDWHDVNGVPTSGKTICECLIREKPEDPEEGTNPNADVPEVECSTPDDCDDWEGDCAFGPSSNHVVCLATDWHDVDGVPTSGKAICECSVREA